MVCEGLDTVSVVSINDIEVGRSVNMFVRYIFDVKHVLKVRVPADSIKLSCASIILPFIYNSSDIGFNAQFSHSSSHWVIVQIHEYYTRFLAEIYETWLTCIYIVCLWLYVFTFVTFDL